MSDLIDTTEMYLRTIYELEEEGVVALRARIAERLGHSGPTVSQTVARMERDGLLHVEGDRHLELTPVGRAKATRVMRKHRLAERLLLDVIGLEWEFVHDEACRWEHVMSERVESKLLTMLSGPMESPYGNPIPGLEELGGTASDAAEFRAGLVSLPEALVREAGTVDGVGTLEGGAAVELPVVVRRLGERLQMNVEIMRQLAAAGIVPGRSVFARRVGAIIEVASANTDSPAPLRLPPDIARHVFVVAAVAQSVPTRDTAVTEV